MSKKLARLNYPVLVLIAAAAVLVAVYFAGREVAPPAVKDDGAVSAARSAAMQTGRAAPAGASQVNKSRSAAAQSGQAAPAGAAQVSKTRSAAMQAGQAAPAGAAQVSKSRSAAMPFGKQCRRCSRGVNRAGRSRAAARWRIGKVGTQRNVAAIRD